MCAVSKQQNSCRDLLGSGWPNTAFSQCVYEFFVCIHICMMSVFANDVFSNPDETIHLDYT